jgi:hypothetical protein
VVPETFSRLPQSKRSLFIEAAEKSDSSSPGVRFKRSVSLIAAEHMQNLHGAAIVIETEPYTPLPDPKPVFGWRDVLKPQHVTERGRSVAVDAEPHSPSRFWIELSEISFRGRGPDDFPLHSCTSCIASS